MPPEPMPDRTPIGTERRPGAVPTVLLVGGALVVLAGVAAASWMMHPPYRHRWMLIDLEVYRAAGRALAAGESVYGPGVADRLVVKLPFLYPPIAAGFALPLALPPASVAAIAWTAATVALLVVVVRLCFAPIVDRYGRPGLVGATVAMLALTPVQEHLRFGQVGMVLLACVVVDCLAPTRRIPTGVLTGIAAAVKLVPGIFVPYLWATGRRRAALIAIVTFGTATLVGAIVAPADSWRFWSDRVFDPVSVAFFSNQSLRGLLVRLGDPWARLWPLAVGLVAFTGFRAGVRASREGDERRGVAIIALVGVLVSPISWIHHLVAVIPALGVLAGRADTTRRALAAVVVTLVFVARVPYIGHDVLGGDGVVAEAVTNAYGLVALGLLVTLARMRPDAAVDQAPPPRSTANAS